MQVMLYYSTMSVGIFLALGLELWLPHLLVWQGSIVYAAKVPLVMSSFHRMSKE